MTRESPAWLIAFFVLTYAITWAFFITVAAAIPASTAPGYVLVLFGVFAPAIAALALTARQAGRDGVRALLARILIANVAAKWYVFAVSYVVVVKLSAALLHRLITGAWPAFNTDSLYLIPLAIAVSTPVQAGEEIGWRGYALPRLADRYGLPAASVVLGAIWALWHLPQFFIAAADTYHQSFLVWAPQVIAISIAMAWLYAKTGGSLLLVMLMHAAINNAKDIVPSGVPDPQGVFSLHASLVGWLALAVLWIGSTFFLIRMPARLPAD
jgi:membrane protease YdiL (CAAX protease family)